MLSFALKKFKEINSSYSDEINNLRLIKNDDYVVKLVDNFSFDGSLYIVFEYCEDGDLGKLIKFYSEEKLLLTEDQILEFSIQISKGLSELHSVNLIHKDIKPE